MWNPYCPLPALSQRQALPRQGPSLSLFILIPGLSLASASSARHFPPHSDDCTPASDWPSNGPSVSLGRRKGQEARTGLHSYAQRLDRTVWFRKGF